ncbi:MAG: dehydrogenase [Hyphomonadaceae bacterium]|nr:dehydrogenase [Hyphomonadaceae bacterium]OUX94512.1 MAG: dehydrogenase [Hyphomonas sp. TMED17]CAI8294423.1 MAG: 1-deoxy-11-beta-hydroxypentalenate dehydrogenase [Hyphomonas sp. TMED17]
MRTYQDSVVVITGGATGIGFGLAKAFGKDGARIILAEPREHRLQEAVDKLAGLGVSASYYVCDVTQPDQVEGLADFAWGQAGRVDVLINNAGVKAPRKAIKDLPLDALHDVFNVNFFGVWHGCAIFGKRMRGQTGPAAIYNVGSENSFFRAVPQAAAYVASKHAVLGLTESLRDEMPDYIDVGIIIPGFVSSEMHDPEVSKLGMDTDRFADIVLEQIRGGAYYVVSHAYNMHHIRDRFEAVSKAFETYAPRYDGDDEYDTQVLIKRLSAKQ